MDKLKKITLILRSFSCYTNEMHEEEFVKAKQANGQEGAWSEFKEDYAEEISAAIQKVCLFSKKRLGTLKNIEYENKAYPEVTIIIKAKEVKGFLFFEEYALKELEAFFEKNKFSALEIVEKWKVGESNG